MAAICVQDVDVQSSLRFTLIHTVGCTLHRHTSRVIHRIQLYMAIQQHPSHIPITGVYWKPPLGPQHNTSAAITHVATHTATITHARTHTTTTRAENVAVAVEPRHSIIGTMCVCMDHASTSHPRVRRRYDLLQAPPCHNTRHNGMDN